MTESREILCGVCGGPVQSVERCRDERIKAEIYRVYCHGSMEETAIYDEQTIWEARGLRIEPGVAFRVDLIANASKT